MEKARNCAICILLYSFLAWADLHANINYTLYISLSVGLLAVLIRNAYGLLVEAMHELKNV